MLGQQRLTTQRAHFYTLSSSTVLSWAHRMAVLIQKVFFRRIVFGHLHPSSLVDSKTAGTTEQNFGKQGLLALSVSLLLLHYCALFDEIRFVPLFVRFLLLLVPRVAIFRLSPLFLVCAFLSSLCISVVRWWWSWFLWTFSYSCWKRFSHSPIRSILQLSGKSSRSSSLWYLPLVRSRFFLFPPSPRHNKRQYFHPSLTLREGAGRDEMSHLLVTLCEQRWSWAIGCNTLRFSSFLSFYAALLFSTCFAGFLCLCHFAEAISKILLFGEYYFCDFCDCADGVSRFCVWVSSKQPRRGSVRGIWRHRGAQVLKCNRTTWMREVKDTPFPLWARMWRPLIWDSWSL